MTELLAKWMTATAWPMEKPVAYGAFHLCFFLGGLLVCVLLALALRRVGRRGERTVLLTVGVLLLLSELYKQLFYTFYIGGGAYQWWIFPFQLCSVPMYLCIAAAFLPECRARQGMLDFMLAFNLMGGFVAFLEPSGLVHEYWTLTVHAFLWHLSLIFLGLFLGFSRRAGRSFRGFRGAAITYLCLSAAAFCINLLLWNVSRGDINMFFVGPKNSSIIVFSSIAERFGWYAATPVFLFANCLGAFLFYLPFLLWNRRHPVSGTLPDRPAAREKTAAGGR